MSKPSMQGNNTDEVCVWGGTKQDSEQWPAAEDS